MSGVAAIRQLLAASQAMAAAVPAERIFAGVAPIKIALPAISITQVSGTEMLTVGMNGATKLRTERVQVTVFAADYASQKSTLELVRTACANRFGLFVGDVDVDSILPDGEGPDLFDDDPVVYSQSRDYMVRWRST